MTRAKRPSIVIAISALLLLLAIDGTFSYGYYLGWSQQYRYNNRYEIVDGAGTIYSLDSIHAYGNQYCIDHINAIELELDIQMIKYVQSYDGGSLGINRIWVKNDTIVDELAKRVAKYRTRHKPNMNFSRTTLDSNEKKQYDKSYLQLTDSIINWINSNR